MLIYSIQLLSQLITPIGSFTYTMHAGRFNVVADVVINASNVFLCSSVITNKCSYHPSSVALCPTPPDINFGTVVVTGNSIGDTATYTCDSGYELIGDAVRTCAKLPNDPSMADFQPEEPFCHREYCMNISQWPWLLSCVNHTRVLKAKSARINGVC